MKIATLSVFVGKHTGSERDGNDDQQRMTIVAVLCSVAARNSMTIY
jgi:hypothetical protein